MRANEPTDRKIGLTMRCHLSRFFKIAEKYEMSSNLQQCVLLSLFVLLGACATIQPRPIPPDEVVNMAKTGMSSEVIIQKLIDSETVYQLSAGDVVKLHNEGVPTPVLDYMQHTYVEAVRREEAQRAFFYSQPPPFYWHGGYPYPWWY